MSAATTLPPVLGCLLFRLPVPQELLQSHSSGPSSPIRHPVYRQHILKFRARGQTRPVSSRTCLKRIRLRGHRLQNQDGRDDPFSLEEVKFKIKIKINQYLSSFPSPSITISPSAGFRYR